MVTPPDAIGERDCVGALPGARRTGRRSRRGGRLAFVLVASLTMVACDTPSEPTPPPIEEPPVNPPVEPPDTTVIPGVGELTLGAPELVMRYATDACEAEDLPDVQVNAFRRDDGTIVLLAGNAPRNRVMTGSSFTSLVRDCSVLLESEDDPHAESFRNQEWVVSVYREGGVVHGFVHNEYHDPMAGNCRPGDTSPANPCWYNAITYARSTDEGRTFTRDPSPLHVVAAPPERWDPSPPGGEGRGVPHPYGYFTPSNIVKGADGAYYMVIFAIPRRDRETERGTCVLRNEDLSNPAGWRAWDGASYSLRLASPYEVEGTPACTFVSRPQIQGLHGSLVYSRYLERYVLLGTGARALPGGVFECGFYISFSHDLIHWTPQHLVREGKLPYPQCSGGNPFGSDIYPSLVDHDDTTVNFEVIGDRAFLYYVRWNRGLDRDLLRQELTFRLR